MSSKEKKSSEKTEKKKTRIDDLEPSEDDEIKGGATVRLSTATATTKLSASDLSYKITPPSTDGIAKKITPPIKPTTR